MTTNTVTEGSSAAFTVAFLDESGVATLPTAVRYRIDCMTTGAEILTWTSLSAATSVSVRKNTVVWHAPARYVVLVVPPARVAELVPAA